MRNKGSFLVQTFRKHIITQIWKHGEEKASLVGIEPSPTVDAKRDRVYHWATGQKSMDSHHWVTISSLHLAALIVCVRTYHYLACSDPVPFEHFFIRNFSGHSLPNRPMERNVQIDFLWHHASYECVVPKWPCSLVTTFLRPAESLIRLLNDPQSPNFDHPVHVSAPCVVW